MKPVLPLLICPLAALTGCAPPPTDYAPQLSRIERAVVRLARATEAPLVYITPEGRRIVLTPRPDGTMAMTEEAAK